MPTFFERRALFHAAQFDGTAGSLRAIFDLLWKVEVTSLLGGSPDFYDAVAIHYWPVGQDVDVSVRRVLNVKSMEWVVLEAGEVKVYSLLDFKKRFQPTSE